MNFENILKTIIVIVICLSAWIILTGGAGKEKLPDALKTPMSILLPTKSPAVSPTRGTVVNPQKANQPARPAGNITTGVVPAELPTIVPSATPAYGPCYIATDARDGHQFCSDGQPMADERANVGFCALETDSFGNYVCANGMPAGKVVNIDEDGETVLQVPQETMPLAPVNSYATDGECVTATRPEGVEQTICNPDPTYPWSVETKQATAQMIKDGTIPATSSTGPKG